MPLGARDILLVIRARNEASGIIRDVGLGLGVMNSGAQNVGKNMMLAGAGLTALGAGFIAAGGAATAFFLDATSGAIEYNRQAALTLTQIDDTGVKLDDIKEIAKRVAKEIPAPFEQMQTSLYDIFSSMDVNISGAETLLKAFSKGAVAGQVDIQAAARASISIMNSFKIPVEDVNHVMDIQFQLVRKGVGTYQEFAEVMGRVTPAAVAAGQSVESMAGMLAFLTRNGLSTAMAATSASRALELLTNPDSTAALEKMGVKTKDASGEFLQMRDIVRQLVYDKGWGKLTGPELKQAFEDTFGKGSIQARRFFDLVIPNFEQFSGLTDDMSNSAGAMDAAYDIMFNQPATKVEELKNRIAIFKEEIGERLVPTFEKAAAVALQILDAWNQLSPGTQTLIIQIVALGAGLAILVGIIMVFVGVGLLMAGAAAVAGVSLTVVGAVVAGIVLAFAALVAIVVLVIQHWDTLSAVLGPVFDAIRTGFETARGKAQEFVDWFNNVALPLIQSWVASALEQFNLFSGWWTEHMGPLIASVGELWDAIVAKASESMNRLWEYIQFVWDIIQNIFTFAMEVIRTGWALFGDNLIDTIQIVWDMIVGIVQGAIQVVQGIIQIVTGVISGDWGKIWDGIKNVLQGAWNIMYAIVSSVLEQMANVVRGILNYIASIFGGSWNGIRDGIVNAWNGFVNIIRGTLENIWNAISGAVGSWIGIFNGIDLWGIGSRIINSLLNGIKSGIQAIKDTFSNLTNMIPSWKGPPERDRKLLEQNGMLIMDGLSRGLGKGWEDVRQQLEGYNPAISGTINATGRSSLGPVDPYSQRGPVVTVAAGAVQVYITVDNSTEDTKMAVQQGVQAAMAQLSEEWTGLSAMGTP